MDTPSRFATVDLACSCGASLKQVDFAHRTSEAEGEFRAQHVGEFHVVSEVPPFRPACVGTFYGNESDAFPCEVADCPACAPQRAISAIHAEITRTKKGED